MRLVARAGVLENLNAHQGHPEDMVEEGPVEVADLGFCVGVAGEFTLETDDARSSMYE